jgi:endoglucanase
VDLFIASGTSLIGKVFNLKIVPVTGAVTEFNIDLNALSPAPVPGTWYSYDKVISYSGPTNNIHEFGVTSNLNNVLWYDNLYFHKNTVLSSDSFAVSNVKLYPNPTSNVLNIESVGTIQNIAIFNVLGQEVMNKTANESLLSLDVSGLNAGVYVIKTVIDGTVSSTKFIKE